MVFEDDTIGVPLVRAAFDDAGLLGGGADACAEATAIAYRVLHNTGALVRMPGTGLRC